MTNRNLLEEIGGDTRPSSFRAGGDREEEQLESTTFAKTRGKGRAPKVSRVFPHYYDEGKRPDAKIFAEHLGGRDVTSNADYRRRGIDVVLNGGDVDVGYSVSAVMDPLVGKNPRFPLVVRDLQNTKAEWLAVWGVARREGHLMPIETLRDRLGDWKSNRGKYGIESREVEGKDVLLVPVDVVREAVGGAYSKFSL
jgi:hypothetical protein